MWQKLRQRRISLTGTGDVVSCTGLSSAGILAQRSFGRLLHLERKRAERSGRPFVLMLLELNGLLSADTPSISFSRLLSALSNSTRETDITGWYEDGTVVGVIFTEIGVAEGRSAANLLLEKVTGTLAGVLNADQLERITVSCQLCPEDEMKDRRTGIDDRVVRANGNGRQAAELNNVLTVSAQR